MWNFWMVEKIETVHAQVWESKKMVRLVHKHLHLTASEGVNAVIWMIIQAADIGVKVEEKVLPLVHADQVYP